MTIQTIDHATLSRLVDSGAVKAAQVVGQRGGWAVSVRDGSGHRTLAAQRSRKVRLFRRIDTLAAYLKQVGISHFEVDAVAFEPDALPMGSRPDRTEALRKTHEAAGHDAWFRRQVRIAVEEADDPGTSWIGDDEAARGWATRRARLKTQAGEGA